MKKLNTLIVLLLGLTIIVAACGGGDEPAPTETPAETPEQSAAPESPLAAPESPLAGPESPLATPAGSTAEIVAETSSTTGAFVGVLRINSETRQEPVRNVIVALARVIVDENGAERATGYDAANAPQTKTDDEGRMVIHNVPPGRYGIILDAVTLQVMLNDPDTGETILVDIKAGEVTDIGVREFESLGIPGYG
jgi:hypothetical protein